MPTEKLDFKKADKALYQPKAEPVLITVSPMGFLLVDGERAPESDCYQEAVQLLYTLSYTIKMSPKSGFEIPGYQDYVVAPLEGLWKTGGGSRENWS